MTSKDLIYRQQAIEAVKRLSLGEKDATRLAMRIGDYLERLPSVQPERKKGCGWCSSPFRIEYYWIDREGNTASFQDEECHVVATGIANFCPNCGADMRQKEGNDD